MWAARYLMENCVIKALDNEEASLQQDSDGFNIGMHCIREGLVEASLKAIENDEALEQKSYFCGSYLDLAKKYIIAKDFDNKVIKALIEKQKEDENQDDFEDDDTTSVLELTRTLD